MDSAQIDGTMTFLQSLCNTPEQTQMLNWMSSQPKEQLTSFLKSSIATIPREGLGALVETHMANQAPETRAQVLIQITNAYDFLKAN